MLDNFDIVLCDRTRVNKNYSLLVNKIKGTCVLMSNRKINRAYRQERRKMNNWSRKNGLL